MWTWLIVSLIALTFTGMWKEDAWPEDSLPAGLFRLSLVSLFGALALIAVRSINGHGG